MTRRSGAATTDHTLSATDRDSGDSAQLTLPSTTSVADSVTAVLAAISVTSAGPPILRTPELTAYGNARYLEELGFERRLLDDRRHTVDDALPRPGSTATVETGGTVVDVTVEAISARG